jgi:membrane peptidoglycan carboxypeptidase
MKYLICTFVISFFCLANEPIVRPSEVDTMLDRMVVDGTITQEQAEAAKLRARQMDEGEWSGLVGQAQKVMEEQGAARTIASENH